MDNHVNILNGNLFRLETNTDVYYVRHADRMAIIALIQNQLVPIDDQIHHGIFYSLPGGSGAYCDRKLKEGIDFADGIYNVNLEYRKNDK